MKVGFVGAGSWGTTLAVHLATLGNDVVLWTYDAEQFHSLNAERENRRYLPGIHLPDSITVTDDVSLAAAQPVVVVATPTQFIRETIAPARIADDALVVSLSKGIERGTLRRIGEVFAAEHGVGADRFVVLSGPSHAEEVARGIPTLVVAASAAESAAASIQALFTSDRFRVYRSDDPVGVELGGALKNVIALCAGILDGLEYGDNTKAALITRGLAEITRLGLALGAQAHTFSGLSGLGDLVVTCTSRHSRNRHVGEQIGRGRSLADITAEMQMIAEGVTTAESAFQLAARENVETPIINEVYRVLFDAKDPRTATYDLMTRETKHEVWI